MAWETATIDEKRQHMAASLGCSPDHPETWPDSLIERLVSIGDHKGKDALFRELMLLMTPPTPLSMR